MKGKVLLIEPLSRLDGRSFFHEPILLDYSLSLAYLSSFLNHRGFNTVWERISSDWIFGLVKKIRPNVIGFNVIIGNLGKVLRMARFVKSQYPEITVILGGHYATTCYSQILKTHNNLVDFIVVGEGEETFGELLCALNLGRDISEIKGVAYYEGDKVKFAGSREPIVNLDKLPFPERKKGIVAGFLASRGGHRRCTFCAECRGDFGVKRLRSIDNIINELNC